MFIKISDTNFIRKESIVSFQIMKDQPTIVFNMINGEKHTKDFTSRNSMENFVTEDLLERI